MRTAWSCVSQSSTLLLSPHLTPLKLACALVLDAVYAVRRFSASRVQWVCMDVAGITLAVATAAVLQLFVTLVADNPMMLSLVLGILATATAAADLFSWGTNLNATNSAAKPPRWPSPPLES